MKIETWYRALLPNYVMGVEGIVSYSRTKLGKECPSGVRHEAVEVYVNGDGNFAGYVNEEDAELVRSIHP